MNKRGKRYIEKRIKLEIKEVNRIVLKIKKDKNLKWGEFSNILNVSEYSIRYGWLKKGNTIPLSIFKRLIKLDSTIEYKKIIKNSLTFDPYWGQKIGKKSHIEDSIILPSTKSIKFAEFYGIMLGDGCVYSNLNGICISSDRIADKNYIEEYVPSLIKFLFGIKPKLYPSRQDQVTRCILYSRKIARFLVEFGFPKGKKMFRSPKIPNIFFKNKRLISACLRGLNDTDGSVCKHPNSKIMIDISILSKSLLKSSIKSFKELGINVSVSKKSINLYGKNKVDNFFIKIGSSNLKHITKYQSLLKLGRVMNKKETEAFLSSYYPQKIDLPYMGS